MIVTSYGELVKLQLTPPYSSPSLSAPPLFLSHSPEISRPNPRPLKATTSDLLSLLGSPQQAASVNSAQLRSCFKFLAPFNQTLPNRRALTSQLNTPLTRTAEEIDHLIWSPPPVLELVRLAVDSGGDPGAIHRALDPTIITVPDVEGSNEDSCELTRYPYSWRFIDEVHWPYIEFLFEIIVERGPGVGLNVSLSRYDFFHGHLFLAKESGRLGIL
ncbi:hypothetical protein SASPL_102679 [Salvia splendens]|uniref:Uncharacterized protein n=1 Tax=Salvia splendens TaxID=180675 RepID=A0A8X8YSD7_SALSN|nr:hypothetical protein SASPL_102679 [Salvia splendens]